MGISIFGKRWQSESSYDRPKVTPRKRRQRLPNPEPDKFTIIRHEQVDDAFVVVEVQYHGCTNYEGRKILVFNNRWGHVRQWKLMDPHFSSKAPDKSPIARFVPTAMGWQMAILFCKSLVAADDWHMSSPKGTITVTKKGDS